MTLKVWDSILVHLTSVLADAYIGSLWTSSWQNTSCCILLMIWFAICYYYLKHFLKLPHFHTFCFWRVEALRGQRPHFLFFPIPPFHSHQIPIGLTVPSTSLHLHHNSPPMPFTCVAPTPLHGSVWMAPSDLIAQVQECTPATCSQGILHLSHQGMAHDAHVFAFP